MNIIYCIIMIMENCIMELGRLLGIIKDKNMEKVFKFCQPDINLKVFLSKAKNLGLVLWSIMMVVLMLGNGKMAISMDKENILILKEYYIKDNGNKVKKVVMEK